MKTLSLITFMMLSIAVIAQSNTMDGAYTHTSGDTHVLWLFKNNYTSKIVYKDNQYVSTEGGPYTLNGTTLTITLEYNDADPATVGSQVKLSATREKEKISIDNHSFQKLPAIKQDLDGLWRITGRQNKENKINPIPRGDRKTIKILVDGYFQWIAINPAEKGFYGTGGGKYVFKDAAYSENIIFFSRDNSRVGQKLQFKGEIKDQEWHHSGLSSKGDPIHEIWSLE